MKTESQLRAEIRQFVVDELLLGDAAAMPADGVSFLESGTIDSTGVLEVVTYLEQVQGIKVLDRELLPENLDCVDNLVAFVARKLHAA